MKTKVKNEAEGCYVRYLCDCDVVSVMSFDLQLKIANWLIA